MRQEWLICRGDQKWLQTNALKRRYEFLNSLKFLIDLEFDIISQEYFKRAGSNVVECRFAIVILHV